MNRSFRLFSAVLPALLLGACSSYLDRNDFASPSLGDAVARNAAIHVIDPWPAHARNTRIVHDGARLQPAIERYRTGEVTEPVSATTTKSSSGR